MKIAIFFPGIGYHCDKPLLYYSRAIACELGYDKIIKLSYSYSGKGIRGNKDKMKEAFDVLYAQAEEALKDIDFTEYEDILFVSKSIGTIIASAYAYEHKLDCKQVLYTPLEYTFDYPHEQSCAFIGTADPWSDIDKVVDIAKSKNVPIFVYDDLNHSLESDNTIDDLEVLKKVMKQTREFIIEPEKLRK